MVADCRQLPRRYQRSLGKTGRLEVRAASRRASYAKQLNGQALSRLLNVCDGVLGQSMRALVLTTTNEPLAIVHPALSRPGRCLAEIEFELFDETGADAWFAANDVPVSGASALSLADLYAHAAGRPPVVRRRRLGFAPA